MDNLARTPAMTSRLALSAWVGAVLMTVSPIAPVAVAAPGDELPLIAAVRAEDVAEVRTLIDTGIDVDVSQPDGATALHWAVFRQQGEIVHLLLVAGADVNVANELGATPLWLAANNGDSELVHELLAAGADPNLALEGGETPVMTASRTGDVDAGRLLLDAGADPNAREQTRLQTALMWAVAQGHPDIVALLVDRGAALGARSRSRPRLMHAEDVNAGQYDQGMMWNHGGFTPLLFASRQGRIAAARYLIAAGADVEQASLVGATPLVLAAHSGQGAFAAFLLESGADPNQSDAGYTALHAAILRGDERLVEALLRGGADPNARLRTGTPQRRTSMDWAFDPALVSATPYWLAAYYREPDIMRDLVAAGADPRLTTFERWDAVFERAGGVGPPHVSGGFMPPLLAVVGGDSGRRRYFLDEVRRDPNLEEIEALATARVALELGADVNETDLNGVAPIHTAAQRNLSKLVRLLAEHGADLNLENGAGRTPLQLADGAAAGRARSQIAANRAPNGNSADVLRELGASDAASDAAGGR